MRYLLTSLLLAIVVLSSGCDPDGYSCNSDGCYADNDTPQYQTLDDCNSICDEQKPGDWVHLCYMTIIYTQQFKSATSVGLLKTVATYQKFYLQVKRARKPRTSMSTTTKEQM